MGADPARARVRVVHERVRAALARPEGDPVRRAALHVRHRSDMPSVLRFLCQWREGDDHFARLWFRPGKRKTHRLVFD